jgi:hypothetical protein
LRLGCYRKGFLSNGASGGNMSEPLVCLCGHDDMSHNERLGYCEAKECRCICFRIEGDFADEDPDDEEEIDFDHGQ